MAITEKTRKILWARSGNRCAICKKELVMEKTMLDSESIIGDECHIISEKPKGPRANYNLEIDYDTYSNLILLCKVHHKIIDDQPNEFSAEYLHKLKSEHESWVKKALENAENKEKNPASASKDIFLERIESGKQLTNIIRGAYGYEFYTPEFESQEEVELLKDFSALIQDYDLVLEDDLSIGFQAEFDLKEQISILESNGFWVFGKQIKKKYKINNEIQVWPIAAIQIVRETDSSIIKICFDDLKKGS